MIGKPSTSSRMRRLVKSTSDCKWVPCSPRGYPAGRGTRERRRSGGPARPPARPTARGRGPYPPGFDARSSRPTSTTRRATRSPRRGTCTPRNRRPSSSASGSTRPGGRGSTHNRPHSSTRIPRREVIAGILPVDDPRPQAVEAAGEGQGPLVAAIADDRQIVGRARIEPPHLVQESVEVLRRPAGPVADHDACPGFSSALMFARLLQESTRALSPASRSSSPRGTGRPTEGRGRPGGGQEWIGPEGAAWRVRGRTAGKSGHSRCARSTPRASSTEEDDCSHASRVLTSPCRQAGGRLGSGAGGTGGPLAGMALRKGPGATPPPGLPHPVGAKAAACARRASVPARRRPARPFSPTGRRCPKGG